MKGDCNSYSVSFLENNIIKYAEIEYFLEINNKCYAFVKLHTQKDSLKALPGSSGFFSFKIA